MKTISKTLRSAAALLALAALAAVPLFAKDATQPKPAPEKDDVMMYLDLFRSDVNTAKIRVLNEVMGLTAAEAGKFWPIYQRYEKELAAVGERKLELIHDFGKLHYSGTLTEQDAARIADGWLKVTQQRLDLWKKYHREISKAVSPIRGAQFLQVENQTAIFIDLNIAAEMPVVGVKPVPMK